MLRGDTGSWTRAQMFLGFYLFAALALLVTTSFLGLRRYLRQRDAEMSSDVTVSWLGGGIAIIAAVMLIAYIAPIPGQVLASIEFPKLTGDAEGTTASEYGWGDEGADQSLAEAATTANDPSADQKEMHSETMKEGGEAGDVGDGNRQDGPAGKQAGGKKKSPGAEGESKSESKQSQAENSSGDKQESAEQGKGEQQRSESQSPGDTKPNQKPPGDESQQNSQPDGRPEDSSTPSQRPSATEALSKLADGFGSLVKLLVVLALAAVVIGFLWKNRDRFLEWLRRPAECR